MIRNDLFRSLGWCPGAGVPEARHRRIGGVKHRLARRLMLRALTLGLLALLVWPTPAFGETGGPTQKPAVPEPALSSGSEGGLPAAPKPGAHPSAQASPTLPTGGTRSAGAAAPADVRLRDSIVFSLRTPHGGLSPSQRASEASRALTEAAKGAAGEVRVETSPTAAIVFIGETPIVQLYAEDADAAGDASLAVHAASTAAKIRKALAAERTRSAVEDTVFSISLVVFLGLVTLYLLRQSGEIAKRLRRYLEVNAERFTSLKVSSYEVLGRGATRLLLSLLPSAAKWMLRGTVVYAYLVIVTTLFAPTRGYAEQLTRSVLAPVSALVSRVVATLPVLVVVLFSAAIVWLLLRLTSLFFASVSQGETKSDWLRRDMAEALGGLAGIAIVVLALVFAAPVVTGQSAGAFAKVGTHLLLALALGAAPILASAGLGAVLVLRRHVRFGDHIELAKVAGVVQHFGLIDLVIVTDQGDAVRIPYLLALLFPLRVASSAQVRVKLSVEQGSSQVAALHALRASLPQISTEATASLVCVDCFGAHYELCAPAADGDVRERLLLVASEALREAGIPLARAQALPPRGPP